MTAWWSGNEVGGRLWPAGRPPAGWRPRLARGALHRRDDVRGLDMVLLPEGVLRLGPTATAVVRLCDGWDTVKEMVARLEASCDGTGVARLLGQLAEQGVFEAFE